MEGRGVNVLYEINIYVHNLYLKIIFDICIDCKLVIYVGVINSYGNNSLLKGYLCLKIVGFLFILILF